MNDVETKLIVHSPKGEQVEFPLDVEVIRIGRDKQNDLVLFDDRASRRHARLERNGETYTLIDMKSSNGTFVNNTEVERGGSQALNDGDEIKIGNHRLLFRVAKRVNYDDKPVGKTVYLQNAAELLRSALSQTDIPKFVPSTAFSSPRAVEEKSAVVDTAILSEMEVLTKRSRMLGFMYQLNKALSNVFSVEQVYQKVSEQIFNVSDCGRIVFAFPKDEGIEVKWIGYKDNIIQCVYEGIPISRSIMRKVIREHVSLSIDSASDPDFKSNPTLLLGKIGAVMCAPLLGQNETAIGAIYIDRLENRLGTSSFSEEELNFLTAVASNAATAVENIEAHKKLLVDAEARLAYLRFLPPFVVDQIMANPGSLELGGVNQTVTMLFADIRGFTTLSERKKPQDIVVLLNNYFERAAAAIFKFNGTLDKFIGDGIMALFGAPKPSISDPVNAIQAAIAIQREVHDLNRELQLQSSDFKIDVGIGINTGEVTAGYIGSKLRTDYTVIGDAVNLAARLESNAKPGQILISEETYHSVRNFMIGFNETGEVRDSFAVWRNGVPQKIDFTMRPLGGLQVKGKTKSVQVYRVFWNDLDIDKDLDQSMVMKVQPPPYQGEERRKEPRIELKMKLYVSGIDTEGKRFDAECTTENISLSGARIDLGHKVEIGSNLFLWGEDGLFQSHGEVTNIQLSGSLYKIGVYLTSTSSSIWQIK
jgi:adenylate cyclase